MAVEPQLSDRQIASLMEVPHPAKALGGSIDGVRKVSPDHRAESGETHLGMAHGIVHNPLRALINTTRML